MEENKTRVIKRRKFINPTLISLDIEREMLAQIDALLVRSLPKQCRNEWIREVLANELNYYKDYEPAE